MNPILRKQLKVGYTTAVDMWSLGVVAVLLLTGIPPFSGSTTSSHPVVTRKIFDLSELQNTTEWKAVRERPRDFISKLLVLDETNRMSADQALKHTWFSNDLHKIDFENLYNRTIKNWHPRIPKIPVITIQKGHSFKSSTSNTNRFGRKPKGGPRPVEPPYIPFPRKMHTDLWPTRKSRYFMSEEVRAAIVRNWSKSGSINNMSSLKAQSSIPSRNRETSNTNKKATSFLALFDRNEEQRHTSKSSAGTLHEAPFSVLDAENVDVQPLDLALRTTRPVSSSDPSSDRDKPRDPDICMDMSDRCPFDEISAVSQQQDRSEILTGQAFDLEVSSNVSMSSNLHPQSKSAEMGIEDESEEHRIYESIESDESPDDDQLNATPLRNMPRATAISPRIRVRPLPRLRSRSTIPKLRRLSSMSETRESKRRASIFDFEDDDSSSDEDSMPTTPKRARTSSISLNKSATNDTRLINSPNRISNMLNIELQQTKSTWHLP